MWDFLLSCPPSNTTLHCKKLECDISSIILRKEIFTTCAQKANDVYGPGGARFINDGMCRPKFSFQNRTLTVQLLISEKGTLTVHFRENFRPLQCNMIRAFEFDSNVLSAFDLDMAPSICRKSKFMRNI